LLFFGVFFVFVFWGWGVFLPPPPALWGRERVLNGSVGARDVARRHA
jgi:hypothetical protein